MMSHHRSMMAPTEPRPAVTVAPTATPGGDATVSFRDDVQPILRSNCVRCHGGQLGLYLDSYETIMAGSSRSRVVLAGDPEGSVLVGRIRGDIQPQMPLDGRKLSAAEIAVIETWIREGAANN